MNPPKKIVPVKVEELGVPPHAHVEITSKQQTGGITAHTVNINSPAAPSEPAKDKAPLWKTVWLVIAAVVAFLAGVIKIVEHFGPKPQTVIAGNPAQLNPMLNKKPDPQPTSSVVSQNQQGGITAHTVTVNAEPPIKGTKYTRTQLDDMYPFGWVVYSLVNGKWTFDPNPGKYGKWVADWSKTEFAISEDNQAYRCVISQNIDYVRDGRTRAMVRGSTFTTIAPLKEGQERFATGFSMENQPAIFVQVLSANPLDPVMVLGFKLRPPKP